MARGLRVVLFVVVAALLVGGPAVLALRSIDGSSVDERTAAGCRLAGEQLIDEDANEAALTAEEIEREPTVPVRRVSVGARWSMRALADLDERDVTRRERRLLARYRDGDTPGLVPAWRLQRGDRRALLVYPPARDGDAFALIPDVVGDLDGDGYDELVFSGDPGEGATLIAFGRPPREGAIELGDDWPATRIATEFEQLRFARGVADCTGDGRRDALLLFHLKQCEPGINLDKCEFDEERRVYAFAGQRGSRAGHLERIDADDDRLRLVARRDLPAE